MLNSSIKNIRIAAFACIAITISGCASLDAYSFTYNELSDKTRILKKTEGAVTVVARREPGFSGSGSTCYFTINTENVAELKPGEQYTLHIMPGYQIVGFICHPSSQTVEASLLGEAGKTYWFRLYSLGAGYQIAPMTR